MVGRRRLKVGVVRGACVCAVEVLVAMWGCLGEDEL